MEPLKGGFVPQKIFYKSSKEENSLEYMKTFFTNLNENEKVVAHISEGGCSEGVSQESLININNYLSSSTCWCETVDWAVQVEYTIDHPDGNVSVSDNENETQSKSVRRRELNSWKATTSPEECKIMYVSRSCTENVMDLDFNSKRYKSVKISRSKRFVYSTQRSSLIFILQVYWKGDSKESAECSDALYSFSLETDDSKKVAHDPKYSSISFLEKMLDIVSLGKKERQLFNFQ